MTRRQKRRVRVWAYKHNRFVRSQRRRIEREAAKGDTVYGALVAVFEGPEVHLVGASRRGRGRPTRRNRVGGVPRRLS